MLRFFIAAPHVAAPYVAAIHVAAPHVSALHVAASHVAVSHIAEPPIYSIEVTTMPNLRSGPTSHFNLYLPPFACLGAWLPEG